MADTLIVPLPPFVMLVTTPLPKPKDVDPPLADVGRLTIVPLVVCSCAEPPLAGINNSDVDPFVVGPVKVMLPKGLIKALVAPSIL